jgi:Putative transposase/Transposase zinc-binding domain
VLSLAEVLLRHWPEYERQFGTQLLPSHRRAVQAILTCRTRALGGEVYRCADCRQDHFVYHSCNHRACPQCGSADATKWIARQKLKLLPVPYYLITFTVPQDLRAWLRSHQKLGYALLLKESAATLQDVARWEKHLGAQLGCLSVLHTWGRQLQFHPHVHCVVPAGGLRPDGLRWCQPKSPDFFLPQNVLAARLRTRLKAALQSQPEAAQIPAGVWRHNWVVDVQPAGRGEAAITYLSAYVYRTALGSQRILKDENGQITFKYKDSADGQWHTLTVSAQEFIRRFLQHVLPKGFQRVRYYGWLSAAATARWQRILALLDWKAPTRNAAPAPPMLCPGCGAQLLWIATLVRAPP